MILLDTSVLLWVVSHSSRLGTRCRARLANGEPTHVSSASIVELTIKSMLGKIDIPDDLDQLLTEQGLLELPVTNAHARTIRHVPSLTKHDPFDRILVAQARCTGMDFLTSDRALLKLGQDYIVDARV